MATGIVLRDGLTLDTLPAPKVVKMLRQDMLADKLAEMRHDWELAASGKPLEEIRASVGMMLDDFARLIELEA